MFIFKINYFRIILINLRVINIDITSRYIKKKKKKKNGV